LKHLLDKSVRLAKYLYQRPSLYPQWKNILGKDQQQWAQLREQADGPRVLVATTVGGLHAMAIVESTLAVALTLRGARVDFLLCDEVLPACLMAEFHRIKDLRQFADHGPAGELCKGCFKPADSVYSDTGLNVRRLSQYLHVDDRKWIDATAAELSIESMSTFRWRDQAIGEHGLAGALRFFAKGDLSDEPLGEKILRRYFTAALMTAVATEKLLSEFQYDCIVCHHGIYIPQGVIGEVGRARQVRIVNWNPAYRKRCFIFSHHETYHHTLMTEPVEVWKEMDWSPNKADETKAYLKSRWRASQDWVFFGDKFPEENREKIANNVGFDPSKPLIGLLTNVVWDAQLHYPQNAFKSMMDWIVTTVEYFKTRADLQLVIRVHPAEVRGTAPSRQTVSSELRRHFEKLPDNIFLVPPTSSISTYALSELCDSVLIYGTKTGVELAAMGIPVIVAGESWIRNKGLTRDAKSRDHYIELLDTLPAGKRMDAASVEDSLKYAHHFFFRRMIPLNIMDPTPMSPPPYTLRAKKLSELEAGNDPGLDTICRGILLGSPFIFERLSS
jgi:hypothetical protein